MSTPEQTSKSKFEIGTRIAARWFSDGKEHKGTIDGESFVDVHANDCPEMVPVKWDNGEHTCEPSHYLIPLS